MLDEEKRLIQRELITLVDNLEETNQGQVKEIQDLRNMSLFLVNTIEE